MEHLVLCVDRDDDLGRKAGVKGPVVGVKNNLEAAQSLALADPEDTDSNAIFAAVQTAKELGCEVVTLIGDADVGITSDKKIAQQLDKVLSELKPESVILVTDGAEDEQIIPTLQSRVKITSVRTVIVRQSRELEKAYFKITNFIKEISEDPNLARLLFGVPGVVLLLLAVGGMQAISFILGLVGIYLIVRGMGYEEAVFTRAVEFLKSLSTDKISTYTYFVSLVVFIVGLAYARDGLTQYPISATNIDGVMNSLNAFILNTVADDLVIGAFVIAIIGRVLDDINARRFLSIRRNLALLAFVLVFGHVLEQGARFWVDENYMMVDFMFELLIVVALFWIWIKITQYLFTTEVEDIKKKIGQLDGREVYDTEGKKIGVVSKVYIEGVELSGIKVGNKKVEKDDIVSVDKVVVVNKKGG